MSPQRKTNVKFYTTTSRLKDPIALFNAAARTLRKFGYLSFARELRQRQYDTYASTTDAKNMLSLFVKIELCRTQADADKKNEHTNELWR